MNKELYYEFSRKSLTEMDKTSYIELTEELCSALSRNLLEDLKDLTHLVSISRFTEAVKDYKDAHLTKKSESLDEVLRRIDDTEELVYDTCTLISDILYAHKMTKEED